MNYLGFFAVIIATATAAGLVLGVAWLAIQVWQDFRGKP